MGMEQVAGRRMPRMVEEGVRYVRGLCVCVIAQSCAATVNLSGRPIRDVDMRA